MPASLTAADQPLSHPTNLQSQTTEPFLYVDLQALQHICIPLGYLAITTGSALIKITVADP